MIGDAFKAKREALGMTQMDVAGRLCLSQSMVAQVETGLKNPTVSMVRLASELFGCTTDELIYGTRREGAGRDGGNPSVGEARGA